MHEQPCSWSCLLKPIWQKHSLWMQHREVSSPWLLLQPSWWQLVLHPRVRAGELRHTCIVLMIGSRQISKLRPCSQLNYGHNIRVPGPSRARSLQSQLRPLYSLSCGRLSCCSRATGLRLIAGSLAASRWRPPSTAQPLLARLAQQTGKCPSLIQSRKGRRG